MEFDEESAPRDEQELMTLELLKRQSRTYYELSQLVLAIESFAEWRAKEEAYTSQIPKPHNVPSSLKQCFEEVNFSMAPIVRGILLHPVDNDEAEDLNYIRNNYIAELVIAYISTLHTAGSIISREHLLDAMDLANAIAEGKGANGELAETNGLEECFAQAGRMRELVECFALISKTMLVMKAAGRLWKGDKQKRGRDLGIWEIGGTAGHAPVEFRE